MQEGGSSIIELGIPYTDPQADGATIQKTNQVAIAAGTSEIDTCLAMVAQARILGLTVPVILMGYYNPFYQFGLDKLCAEAAEAGADGFIVVDLPPEEGVELAAECAKHGLSNVPLIAPTTSDERIAVLAERATSFLYCVSTTGVTGARADLPPDLSEFIARIRARTPLPLAVGFGISTPDMVQSVANIADGVVVGSELLKTVGKLPESASTEERAESLRAKVSHLCTGLSQDPATVQNQCTELGSVPAGAEKTARHAETHFGKFGGQFIPETLSYAFREIEEKYNEIKNDPGFLAELAEYRKDFVGGPTPVHLAERLTEYAGGARIWLKREDLAHTGAHKINNAIGQALLAKRIGKPRIIAETGAGQHGVATATVCAMLGLDCTVYMGKVDTERQKLNVFRMNTLGAKVVAVETGQMTLKDAINEAMRDWATIVRDFQSVIGKEMRVQMLDKAGKLPDAVIACM